MADESPMDENQAQIEALRSRIDAWSQASRFPQEAGDTEVAKAVRAAGSEIALAIREVGAMVADSLDTIEKQATGGWKPWGKE